MLLKLSEIDWSNSLDMKKSNFLKKHLLFSSPKYEGNYHYIYFLEKKVGSFGIMIQMTLAA